MKSTIVVLSAIVGAASAFAPAHSTTARPSTSLAFFGNAGKKKSPAGKSSPLADEAVEIFANKYLNKGSTRKKFFFESWGMPGSYQKPEDTSESIFSSQANDVTATFNTLASLYGDEEALTMVKIQPSVLAFNKDDFGPSLEAFGEKFGLEESKAMIMRNPGLLSSKRLAAESADDLTMQLSYVVQFTRPIGAAGPIILVGLLCVPAIESFTGVSRGELLSSLF